VPVEAFAVEVGARWTGSPEQLGEFRRLAAHAEAERPAAERAVAI
jgi:hypothetical protein